MDNTGKYTEYVELLKANKNLILTGAPGTGKTFLAREIAKAMGAEYEFVQFHPSYDYTDFVEGLRPTPPDRNGNISFRRVDGIFKRFCRKVILSMEFENCAKTDVKNVGVPKDLNKRIEKSMAWLMKQDGAKIKSFRSETEYTLVIKQNKIYLRIPKGKENYVNPNGIIRYLMTGYFDDKHQTYEPSVGDFIKERCPYYNKNINIENDTLSYSENYQHKDILSIEDKEDIDGIKEIKPYIFIIDEINRGEISKIFGELFFSIDPGYRGEKGLVQTQYQNMITDENDPFFNGFYVPENVYIIGTMNDIDRSVESMDFAMRRRFAWKEVKANDNIWMLDDLGELKEEVERKMINLNNTIWNEERNEGIDGLSSAYHIGGAYFLKLKPYLSRGSKEEAYKKLWDNHLRGVLFEYLRGSFNVTENMVLFEKAYYSDNEAAR